MNPPKPVEEPVKKKEPSTPSTSSSRPSTSGTPSVSDLQRTQQATAQQMLMLMTHMQSLPPAQAQQFQQALMTQTGGNQALMLQYMQSAMLAQRAQASTKVTPKKDEKKETSSSVKTEEAKKDDEPSTSSASAPPPKKKKESEDSEDPMEEDEEEEIIGQKKVT